ncbi:MAG: hypothetical protein WCI89_02180 [bacterium]
MHSFFDLWYAFRHLFIPSYRNAYRPRVLHRSWLMFFLALMLGVEGFLMTSLISQQSNQAFFAGAVVAGTTPMTAGASNASNPAGLVQTTVRQIARFLGDSRVVNALLEAIAGMLFLAVLITFFVHIQIQSKNMLLGGVLVAVLALLFVYSNTHGLLAGTVAQHAQMASAAASLW